MVAHCRQCYFWVIGDILLFKNNYHLAFLAFWKVKPGKEIVDHFFLTPSHAKFSKHLPDPIHKSNATNTSIVYNSFFGHCYRREWSLEI